ncbi:MAG TPA: hypothetical protein PKM73_10405 [Verrucomicrobiota bacterium]|nr:hypothetical protein [Verrucomicrobiota bacterium]
METELELLDPVRVVDIGTEKVQVRELRWVDTLRFLEKLAHSIEQVLGAQAVGPDGSFRLNAEKLREAVLSSGELANTLLAKATGLPQERLDALSASQALTLLEAAVQTNFREDLLGKFRGVGQSLRGVFNVTASAR